MRKINPASLKKREAKFINRLEQLGNKFSYISGYKGYKYPVKVRHNKCGSEFEVIAETIMSKKKADDCAYCTTSIRGYSKKEIQNKINENYTNLKLIRVSSKSKKRIYVIQCMTCKHTYKVTYSQLKNKTFRCCSGSKSNYVRHLDTNVRQIMKAMRPNYLLNKALYNFIEESVKDLSYIKSKTVDKENFIFDIYQEINYIYAEKQIAKCKCCEEFKRKTDWGTYKSNYKNRVCYSCLTKMKKCSACSELKKQKEFNFNKKTKTFDEKCKKCSEE